MCSPCTKWSNAIDFRTSSYSEQLKSAEIPVVFCGFLGHISMKWLIFLLFNIAGINSASAIIYKCEDFNGNITYSQTACPKSQSLDKVMHIANSYDKGVECGIVRSFAAEVGLKMERNGTVPELEQSFGGADILSTLALNIIRSVHEYQSRPYRTVEDSVYHEGKICKDELYGEPRCSDFPTEFIRIYGSCLAASDVNKRIKRIAEYQLQIRADINIASNTTAAIPQQLQPAANQTRQPSLRQVRKDCQAPFDKKLKSNREKSRQSKSVGGQDELRKQRRELRSARKDC